MSVQGQRDAVTAHASSLPQAALFVVVVVVVDLAPAQALSPHIIAAHRPHASCWTPLLVHDDLWSLVLRDRRLRCSGPSQPLSATSCSEPDPTVSSRPILARNCRRTQQTRSPGAGPLDAVLNRAYMADSNFSAPMQSPYSMPNPNPPGPPFHGPDTSAQPMQAGFSNYNSFSYETSGFHQFNPSPYGSQMSNTNQTHHSPYHYPHQSRVSHPYQYSPQLSNRPNGYYHHPADSDMYQTRPNPAPSAAAAPFQSPLIPGSPHPDFPESRNDGALLPMIEPLIPNGSQMYSLPPYGHFSSGPIHSFNTVAFAPRRPGIPQSNRHSEGVAQSAGQGRTSTRTSNFGNPDQAPRHLASPIRRPSHERQQQQSPGGPDRRPQAFLATHNRRSDRSVSPSRTSHRRSWDRYSTDLPSSSTSSEENEQLNRQRALQHQRRHERRQALASRDFFRHRHVGADSNTPTGAQMQALRDKLRHFLPSELPEGSSTCCDICQKDYSAKHIDPTEEDEVAIQLPCKHVFGEHCINTWFETCKTHKNKITCPMCRKVLIEPMRGSVLFPTSAATADFMAFFSRSLDHRQPLSQQEQNVFAQIARTREMEGDFAHM